MSEDVTACAAHRALVAEVMGPDPSDAALERYALEIPECAPCRKALVVALGVHPAVLDRAGRGDLQALAGMRELREVVAAPAPPRRAPWPAIGLVALALAAGAAFVAWPTARAPSSDVPAPPTASLPEPRPVAEALPPVEAPAPPVAPDRLRPAPAAPVVPTPSPRDDGVAEADDWPAPPFEDLRDGTPKSGASPVRALQLVMAGGASRRVGDTVALTVVSSTEASLAVCVTGPERGVVWRGAVAAGRTALSRSGHPQSFAFGAPGTYRFAVGTTDLDRCADPVHVVEVEVGG